jgi:hypothetical protein
MDLLNSIIRGILHVFFAALAWAPPVTGLVVISLAAGAAMLWVFKKTSNPAKIRGVKRLLMAYLLEMRIYRDEPGVVLRAQGSLLLANLKYIGLMLLPAVWLAAPLTILLIHLESFYGRSPLPIGREAVVTMAMRTPVNVTLEAPPGINVETRVRVLDEGQISWRIRPVAEVSGDLHFTVDGARIDKRIEAGAGQRFVPGRRASSVLGALWSPDEPRIASNAVEWIDIQYPAADVDLFGIRMHWLVWFTAISMLLALLLRKRFGVVL